MQWTAPFLCGALLCVVSNAASGADARWTFSVGIDPARAQLQVSACSVDAHARVDFGSGSDNAMRFLLDARRDSDATLIRRERSLMAHDWRAGECLLTRIDLAREAQSQRRGARRRDGDPFLPDPRHWLWRPQALSPDSTIRFELPAGWSASVPWPRVAGETGAHRLGATPADWPALTGFGRFEEQVLKLPGGILRIALLPPWNGADLVRIEPVARALLGAYGRLPRAETQILVLPLPGRRDAAIWGQVTRGGGSAVHLFAGADARHDALLQDWTATHEFSHLLHPYLGTRGRWLGEGLASYYQNVLRARAGVIGAEDAWSRIDAGFDRGRADQRSKGMRLEQASRRVGSLRTFMRVYWSGAAYWLEADLALRERGDSLDHVLQRYAECCLQQTSTVSPEAFVAELDRLARGDVFTSRHRRYAQMLEFPDTGDIDLSRRTRPEIAAAIMRGDTRTQLDTTTP